MTNLELIAHAKNAAENAYSPYSGFKVGAALLDADGNLFCGFIYDESLGMPEHDIPPGTRWQDVPEDWLCPDCGNGKSDFMMEEI